MVTALQNGCSCQVNEPTVWAPSGTLAEIAVTTIASAASRLMDRPPSPG
jgi:hypothetical protein